MSRKTHVIHFRRCHVCGAVTEQVEKIERCVNCGKSIVPFLYYDDMKIESLSENSERPKSPEGEWKPIHGLTAYW